MKLSVIIPGYNTHRDWWVRCVQSVAVAAAKVGEYEIVCVDDGSKEPVEAMWFDGIDGVRIVRQENKGLPTARNVGIEHSTGEFISFIDSDDVIREATYSRTIAAMEGVGADVGVFGIRALYEGLGFSVLSLPEDKNYGVLTPSDVASLVKQRLFYYSCNKVFRRSFFEANGLRFDPQGVPCEDAIFNVGLVVHHAKWVTVAYEGYEYYRYDGTICSNYKSTYVAGTRACTKAWRDYKAATPGAVEEMEKYGLGRYDETSEAGIVCGEWTNIWRRNSPYTLRQRYRYAKENAAVLGRPTALVFLKKAIVMWLRAHCYIRPIRRWHQMRFMRRIGAKVEVGN